MAYDVTAAELLDELGKMQRRALAAEAEVERLRAAGVSDEVVEVAALAMFADEHCDKRQMLDVRGNWDARLNDEDQALYRSMARAALEAVARLERIP